MAYSTDNLLQYKIYKFGTAKLVCSCLFLGSLFFENSPKIWPIAPPIQHPSTALQLRGALSELLGGEYCLSLLLRGSRSSNVASVMCKSN